MGLYLVVVANISAPWAFYKQFSPALLNAASLVQMPKAKPAPANSSNYQTFELFKPELGTQNPEQQNPAPPFYLQKQQAKHGWLA